MKNVHGPGAPEKMDIVNCQQCGKPFMKKGSLKLCSPCVDKERQMYDYYYQKLSRLLHLLNYAYIARQLNFNLEQLETTLKYRLGTGEIRELRLWKRGTCNVCNHRLKNVDSAEPLCVICLDHIIQMVEGDKRALFETSNGFEGSGFRAEKAPEKLLERPLEKAEPQKTASPSATVRRIRLVEKPPTPSQSRVTEETVPRGVYDQVVQELDYYRQHFGQLPPELLLKLEKLPELELAGLEQDLRESIGADPQVISSDPGPSRDEILKILEQDDEAIVFSDEEVRLLQNAHRYASDAGRLQYYGFKRAWVG